MIRMSGLVGQLRRGATPLENHFADEFVAGRLDRRGLLRQGARIGMGLPLLGALLGTLDPFAMPTARAQLGNQGGGKPGATIRVACLMPSDAIDPVTVANAGGLVLLAQTGEFLAADGEDLVLRPALATSWTPNADGSIWTFALRPGVKFHNGHVLNADDVVATMDRLTDPKNGSNALSVLRGVLSVGGTKKLDDLTVAFHLDAPNGNFPYYVSSDNYNAIILPADYAGDFEKNFNGTGPFKLDSYTPKVGASFVRNPDYWGQRALPDRTEFSFFADQQPQILALQGKQVDVVVQLAVHGAQGLLNDPDVKLIKLHGASHRQVHMRTDMPKFADKRVRQAIALTLDRPALVTGLFRGLADVGNDSPFAPIYPSTDKSVPQRAKDLARARELLAAAGGGFAATLTTERLQEIPDYAVLLKNACAEIGVKLSLKVEDQSAYYGNAKFGTSDWLDAEIGITDYGHRGVPNVMLSAPLLSTGSWNSSHFRNAAFDRLVGQYVAAIDLQTQRGIAKDIDTLLLDETPVIIAYFFNYITAVSADVTGVRPTAIAQVDLQNAAIG
ncbi:MAG TPA: ABC transporter substrate-binding protein [Acetobacteraceae bacterium]|jgi:peptide/nickel transport system substrate-binding protein